MTRGYALCCRPAGSVSIRAAIAGWRRSLSRQRRRLGPMLPTGMRNLALIGLADVVGIGAAEPVGTAD